MSKSLKSLASKRTVTVTIGVIAVLVLLAWPLNRYSHHEGLVALQRGEDQTDRGRSLVWYQVADLLAPHDQAVLSKLAGAEIRSQDDAAALAAANRAIKHGAGSTGYVLKSQALLELNRNSEATTAAEAAARSAGADQAAQLQLGLCYAVSSDEAKLSQTIALLSASEAARTLESVEHNHFALAQELYLSGLLNSSGRILDKYQVESSDYYLLKARIGLQLGQDDKQSLGAARDWLARAIAISPERVDLRQLLQSIDNKLGDNAAAAEQGSKIQALQAGKV